MPRLERRTDADGVAKRDFVAAEIPQHLCDVHHGLRLHLAVIGATEHAGDIAAYLDAVSLGSDDDRLEAVDGFGDRAIDIGPRKAFRGRGKYCDHPGAGRARGVVALFVRHQHVEFAVWMVTDATQDLIRIHHLRDRLRRHERSDFDGVQPGADQRLDKGYAGHDAAGSISASSTPSCTISPTLHFITFSTPANGARRVCSIFITSSVRIAAPFSSVAPTSASNATTVPGSGATILSSPTCSSVSPPKGSTQCRSKRPLRVRKYSSWPSITATTRDFMPSSARSNPPSARGDDAKANSRSPIDSVAGPLPYCRHISCSASCACRNVNTRCRRPTGIQPDVRHGECASARAAFCSSSRIAATAAQTSRSPDAAGGGVRLFNSRSMKPVSMALARTCGCVTSAERKGMLVTMPRTSVSPSPRLSLSIAASRVGAHAIALASMAS